MAHTIKFATVAALSIYASMAEGMEEVQRDCDETARADSIARVAEAVWAIDVTGPSLLVWINDNDAQAARDILENCLDTSDAPDGDDDDLRRGEVTIAPAMPSDPMGCREALEVAAAALTAAAAETDTASPDGHRLRLALAAVEAMMAQRGCEHLDRVVFGQEREGTLPEIMDCLIYG